MKTQTTQGKTSDPHHLTGTLRRFGAVGIVYQILAIEDDKNIKVRVIETGEQLVYPLSKALSDPIA